MRCVRYFFAFYLTPNDRIILFSVRIIGVSTVLTITCVVCLHVCVCERALGAHACLCVCVCVLLANINFDAQNKCMKGHNVNSACCFYTIVRLWLLGLYAII